MPPRKSQKKVVATEGQTPYNIHILSEGQSGCPPEQYHALLESVRLHGLYSPVILYQNKILDGRSRYRACRDLGIAPTVEEREFASDDEARRFLRAANGWRAHVGAEQRAASYLLDPASAKRIIALKVKAEANQKAGKFIAGNMSVDEQVGREIGVHRSTVQRILRVLRDANYGGRDQVKKIAAGEMTCSQWTNKVRKANKSAWLIDQTSLGVKQFDVIYADPPWPYPAIGSFVDRAGATSFRPDDHYATLEESEILRMGEQLEPYLADDCFLFLWTPSSHLPLAMDVVKAWDFTYVTSMVWHKTPRQGGVHRSFGAGCALGQWLNVNHEIVLIGRRGRGTPWHEKQGKKVIKSHSCRALPLREYNRKPDEFRETIETMFPLPHRRLELFARSEHEGWTAWGNEVDKHTV